MNSFRIKKFIRFLIALVVPVWLVFFIFFILVDAIDDDDDFRVAGAIFDTWFNWIRFIRG